MYIVKVFENIYEVDEFKIAGIFDTEEKAYKVKAKVEEWLEEEGYEDFEVFVTLYEINHFEWEDFDEVI